MGVWTGSGPDGVDVFSLKNDFGDTIYGTTSQECSVMNILRIVSGVDKEDGRPDDTVYSFLLALWSKYDSTLITEHTTLTLDKKNEIHC